MKKTLVALSSIVILAACSQPATKVVVYTKGDPKVNKDDLKISVPENGSGHNETTLQYHTSKALTMEVNSQVGKASLPVGPGGLYIINAKPDTLIGSFVLYSAPKTAPQTYTQDFIKNQIDSLQLLIEGKNISAANRNYYVLPNTVVKVTDNPDATLVGPFHKMTSIAKEGDKEPEVYRFYTINEVRETLAKLQALTVAEKQ
jgi:hypothetical protein